MQLLSDANNENKLKERQESHVMEVKLHCLDMKCIDSQQLLVKQFFLDIFFK